MASILQHELSKGEKNYSSSLKRSCLQTLVRASLLLNENFLTKKQEEAFLINNKITKQDNMFTSKVFRNIKKVEYKNKNLSEETKKV